MKRTIISHFTLLTAEPNGAASVEIAPGGYFRVLVDGDSVPKSVQWMKNGKAIAGETDIMFQVSESSEKDAGKYSALVTERDGSTKEIHAITITINPKLKYSP